MKQTISTIQNRLTTQSVPKLICNTTNPILHPFLAPDEHYCVLSVQICLHFYKYIYGNIKYTLFCGEETWFPSLNLTTLKIYSYVTTINDSLPFACAQYTLYWSLILTSGLFLDCRFVMRSIDTLLPQYHFPFTAGTLDASQHLAGQPSVPMPNGRREEEYCLVRTIPQVH